METTFLGVVYSSPRLSKLMWEKNYTKGKTSCVSYSENSKGSIVTNISLELLSETIDWEEDFAEEKDLMCLTNDIDFPWITYIALPLDVLARELEQLGVTFAQGYPTYEEIEEAAMLHFNAN